jgi:hypothetical protein
MSIGEILIAVSMMCAQGVNEGSENGYYRKIGRKEQKQCVTDVMTCLLSKNVWQIGDNEAMGLKKLINCLGR